MWPEPRRLGMRIPGFLMLALLAGCARPGIDSVTYRGEEIRLSRTYADFDEYKDDDNNLPAEEIPRVAALVKGAPIASSYPSKDAAFEALYELSFPGYGFSAMNVGQSVALFALEIPQMSEQRYVAFVQKGGDWALTEDFTWQDADGFLAAAELVEGRIRYLDHKGHVMREKKL
jgi:hypothetical protein